MNNKISNEIIDKPMFSVTVTAYNCSQYIIETLQSIDQQTYKDYEVIIIDDASSDGTYEVINDYIRGKDNWQLHRNEENKGVVYSRNRAFDLAKGKYIAILDGDDVWLSDKLEKQYNIMSAGDVGLCYSSYKYINEKSQDINYTYKVKEKISYKKALKENYIGCSTAVFSRDIVNSLKMQADVEHEDYYFWLQILKRGIKAYGIREPLVKYRIHKGGRSFNKIKAAKNRFRIYYDLEKLGLPRSIWCFVFYSLNAFIKYSKIFLKSRKAF